MHFSLRSFLLFVAGVAIVIMIALRSPFALMWILLLFASLGGAFLGRRRFWSSCLLGGLGGALATWLGLILWAYVLPWEYIPDPQLRADMRVVYQTFVRETFVSLSAFVMFEGLVIGVLVAIVVFVTSKIMKRVKASGHATTIT